MRYTQFAAILLTSASLALGIGPAQLAAAGPHSRTAPDDDLRFPLSDIGDVCPSEEPDVRISDDPQDAAAGDVADRPTEGATDVARSHAVRQPGESKTADEPAVTRPNGRLDAKSADSLDPRMTVLRDRVRETLAFYNTKRLNTRDHNPWEVMHSIVAYGVSSDLSRNGPDGKPVNAISWLCWNGECHQTRILEVSDGRVGARKGPRVQGHPGQFLAILAQSRVATNCPIKVGNERFTLADLIESEKLDCQTGTELTFKLISFSYYLDIDARWKNSAGQNWSIERLVHEELAAPIVGAACGGTHRLMGLAYAVRKREQSGQPVTGEFGRARKYLDDYHRYTLTKLENADGSFSTEWFKAPGARPDLGRRIQTSGHILEWLSYSLPVERLEDPRVVKAVEYLSGVLHDGKDRQWEIGPLGHALHSLAIYDSRVFKPLDGSSDSTSLVDITATTQALDESDQATSTPESSPTVAADSKTQPRVTRREPRPQPQRSVRRPPVARP